jgi:hypothetical protein
LAPVIRLLMPCSKRSVSKPLPLTFWAGQILAPDNKKGPDGPWDCAR